MKRKSIVIDQRDSVATLLESAQINDFIETPFGSVTLLENIPFGHKVAIKNILAEDRIYKYGEDIGYALKDIPAGSRVHIHNMGCDILEQPDAEQPQIEAKDALQGSKSPESAAKKQNRSNRTFMGYRRANGTVGVRNIVAIIPSVLCADTTAKLIEKAVPEAVALTHGVGCGQYGYDAEITARTLIAMGSHPNVAAVLVLGLGCERFQSSELEAAIRKTGKPVSRLVIQEEGDIGETAEKGIEIVKKYVEWTKTLEREECNLSELFVATKCGGTDAMSGLAANPTVGVCCDRLIEAGGSAVISEVGELLGAEKVLMRRAASKAASDAVDLTFRNYRAYLREHCDPRYEKRNDLVTPGNEDGGTSNVVEKALGGVCKSGSSPIQGVIEYAEAPKDGKKGFFLMNYGNHDGEVVTGMIGCGCQIVLFTTGRGTPVGHPIAPVVKLTGNEQTYQRMKSHFDFCAGTVISRGDSIDTLGENLLDLVIRVANGEETCAEKWEARELFCIARHS